MPDDARNRYLAELDGVLPMPPEHRAEVVAEIAAHLDDAVAERIERGVEPGRAEADAQARLGPATELARSLARSEQSTSRMLAGVGAALWSGTGNWIFGYLFGSLVVFVTVLALSAFVQAIGVLLGTGWTLMTGDMGWNTMLTAIAIGVGCYFAGRVLPDRLARHSRHLAADVRPWILASGIPLVGAITIFAMELPQNWASVVALILTPAGVAIGAYWPNLLPGKVRFSAVAVVLLLLVAGVVSATLAAGVRSGSRGGVDEADAMPDRGLAMVGPEWHPGAVDLPPLASSSWGDVDGATRWEGELATGVSLAAFTDLRIEAWRTTDDGMRLDPAGREPFATAPVRRDGRALSALIDTTNEPGVVSWDLVLTGVDGAGLRWVVDASGGGMSTFTGSAWNWIVAVATED